jgi:2'-hydroxyisoflavone reductase
MDVLVLGGSVFLGRAVVDEALSLGATVTVFNRGRSGPVPPGATHVRGDRTVDADLAQLSGRVFDVVVDTSGYVPAVVGRSAALLAPSSGRYAFISTINVWPGWPDEADYYERPVHDGSPDAEQAPDGIENQFAYGWLKVGCERAAARAFGEGRTSVLRAGCIVGPHDAAVGRLPWWIDRISHGGEVLVPGSPDDPVALIDARDLARFALTAPAGTFGAGGPFGRDTRADLMAACAASTGADPSLTYVGDDWLAGQDVAPWTEVPLWAPASPGLFAHDNSAAVAAALTWRPLAATVADTWGWMSGIEGGWTPSERTPGLAPAREEQLLAAFAGQ